MMPGMGMREGMQMMPNIMQTMMMHDMMHK